MKKPVPVTLAIIVAGLILLLGASAYAQVVTVKIEAMSPGRRIGVTGPNYISTGLRVFAKGMKMYMSADTTGSGTAVVTSYTWSFLTKPTGSAAVLDSTDKKATSFKADVVGEYKVVIAVNGGAAKDTQSVFASTYLGWPTQPLGCQTCHAANAAAYATTAHATIFNRGITGQLEVDATTGKGAYAKSCVRCHTTGWESVTDNGNFGYIANQTKWDSTWWKGLTLAAGDYWVPYKDMTLANDLATNYTTLAPVATIGCEQCHGAGKDHNGDKTKIASTFDAGVCLQCHDAPNKHRIGKDWKLSAHSTMPKSGGESSRTACWPCHNGPAIAAIQKNAEAPDYTKIPAQPSISCQSCHDVHGSTNERLLRVAKADTLMNKYVIPAGIGGKGQLCMVCHRSRYDTNQKVAAQKNVFSARFYAHYSPQTDMYLGTNGYEFGRNLSGLMTHEGAEDACVTCHMAPPDSTTTLSNHSFSMVDPNGKDRTTACKACHGEVASFEEIKGMQDYDGNGKIEGTVTEVANLLTALKATLPLDATGEVVTGGADSVKVKAHPKYPTILGAMWNYWFVKQDFSGGIHNAKYAIALLKLSLTMMLTSVEPLNQDVPKSFGLGQNYPNPFNPTTSFQFSIPRSGQVKLHIFDASGRLMTTLADGYMVPGNYSAMWNGRDNNGVSAASGVYFYRLEVVNNGQALYTSTRKMVMLK